MVGIYKITNPIGKIYIGQSVNIPERFKSYKYLKQRSIGPKLFYSLNKYGFESHSFIILEQCQITELNDREVYWKLQYGSFLEGLNCELYDNSTGPKSETTKAKISQALLGRLGGGTKAILQYDNLSNLVGRWDSSSDVHKQLGWFASAISECCHGKRKNYKGYTWTFE